VHQHAQNARAFGYARAFANSGSNGSLRKSRSFP
jgi:hypothetical protein